MKRELEFPTLSVDDWAQTEPMTFDEKAAGTVESVPCPWGYEMMGAMCSMEHTDGRRLAGRLLQWDPARNRCLISTAADHAEVCLPLPQLRLVALSDVLPPGSSLTTGQWGGSSQPALLQQFRIELDAGRVITGVALCRVERPEGLYLARMVSAAGAAKRLFVSGRAVIKAEFTPTSGLNSTGFAAPVGAVGAQPVARLEPVSSVQALQQAVDAQSRQPVRRLGDILLAMGLVNAQQLAGAMQAGNRDDGLPLGQRMVSAGLVSPENLQHALHLKMGYPCVDLRRFLFDRTLLKTMTYRLAAELRVLPLTRMGDGRLVVALDDPGRLAQLKELRVLFNAPLVAAMPWKDSVQRMIPDVFGVGEIGDLGQGWFG